MSEQMKSGAEQIAGKVRTNRKHKGYTPEHDDTHVLGELLDAALCYAERARLQGYIGDVDLGRVPPQGWPFESSSWRPSDDPVRNLVHAGALIAAEIDRLQRAVGSVSQ